MAQSGWEEGRGTGEGVIYVGTAGWSVPSDLAARFPGSGTHLERYARILPGVEINTTFYRLHEPKTFARWGAAVPAQFRFAVKVPREITHFRRLANPRTPLQAFLAALKALGKKLGPLLVQLPPSLEFEDRRAETFFRTLRRLHRRAVVCEPRHASWFDDAAENLLRRHRVARVSADPAPVAAAAVPGGWSRVAYYRLHGSPRMYYSAYGDERLTRLASELRGRLRTAEIWCIFDNTAAGAATMNALDLLEQLRQ